VFSLFHSCPIDPYLEVGASARYSMCRSWRACYKGMDILNFSSAPIQGSTPILTFLPLPIFHATQSPIRGKSPTRDFHTIDLFLTSFLGQRIHSTMDWSGIYFFVITLPHKDEFCMSLHKPLSAKA
jgi:hypothetical protein